jgi:hypothetical protein
MQFRSLPNSLKGIVWPSAVKGHVFMTSPALKNYLRQQYVRSWDKC